MLESRRSLRDPLSPSPETIFEWIKAGNKLNLSKANDEERVTDVEYAVFSCFFRWKLICGAYQLVRICDWSSRFAKGKRQFYLTESCLWPKWPCSARMITSYGQFGHKWLSQISRSDPFHLKTGWSDQPVLTNGKAFGFCNPENQKFFVWNAVTSGIRNSLWRIQDNGNWLQLFYILIALSTAKIIIQWRGAIKINWVIQWTYLSGK